MIKGWSLPVCRNQGDTLRRSPIHHTSYKKCKDTQIHSYKQFGDSLSLQFGQKIIHRNKLFCCEATVPNTMLHTLHTLMIPWQVASGSPTRLVSLMDIIWSPTLSLPERAAGPLFSMLARMTVGRMEPQPDSTITTPRLSPFCFSTYSWNTEKAFKLFF